MFLDYIFADPVRKGIKNQNRSQKKTNQNYNFTENIQLICHDDPFFFVFSTVDCIIPHSIPLRTMISKKCLYPFTAPAANPLTIKRWAKSAMISTGSVMIHAAA